MPSSLTLLNKEMAKAILLYQQAANTIAVLSYKDVDLDKHKWLFKDMLTGTASTSLMRYPLDKTKGLVQSQPYHTQKSECNRVRV